MQTNDKNFNIDNLINDLNLQNNLHNYIVNDIYLSNNQINILKRNHIDYKKYTNLSALMYDIEEYLNDNIDCDEELDNLLVELSEFNYYRTTKK